VDRFVDDAIGVIGDVIDEWFWEFAIVQLKYYGKRHFYFRELWGEWFRLLLVGLAFLVLGSEC
jgi:hypothetical protein